MSGVLLNRCQYAFKAASALALAGQVVEVFPILRSVLEYAGYCLLLRETPELQSVFILRHRSPKEKQRQKDNFKIGSVKAALRRVIRTSQTSLSNFTSAQSTLAHTQIRTRYIARWSPLTKG
jgi:hypothetical protein